jgi:prepilin-type N-terminal cleavage/methylation domain-containing protein
MKIVTQLRPTSSNQKGFTLIELLLYISISAIILGAVSLFLILIVSGRVKSQVTGEVEGQGAFVMQEIGQAVRNAWLVNTPVGGASVTTTVPLSLKTFETAKNPTVFSYIAAAGNTPGSINIKEGAGIVYSLTSPAVSITNLNITYLNDAPNNNFRVVNVSFTLSYVNSSGRNEYNYSKTFNDSFNLRSLSL